MADIVGRGDYSVSLKKAFDLRARSSYNLAGEIVPVAAIADLEGPPYHSKLGFSHWEAVAAGGAGTTAWMVLTVKAGLSDIGVLRYVSGGAASAGSFFITALVLADLPALGANLTLEDWDLRTLTVDTYNVARVDLKTGTPVASAIPRKLGLVTWPAGGQTTLEGPWVFDKDHWIAIVATATNAAIQCTLYGDVYPK